MTLYEMSTTNNCTQSDKEFIQLPTIQENLLLTWNHRVGNLLFPENFKQKNFTSKTFFSILQFSSCVFASTVEHHDCERKFSILYKENRLQCTSTCIIVCCSSVASHRKSEEETSSVTDVCECVCVVNFSFSNHLKICATRKFRFINKIYAHTLLSGLNR